MKVNLEECLHSCLVGREIFKILRLEMILLTDKFIFDIQVIIMHYKFIR